MPAFISTALLDASFGGGGASGRPLVEATGGGTSISSPATSGKPASAETALSSFACSRRAFFRRLSSFFVSLVGASGGETLRGIS
jgi:hypothetical protein